MGKGGALFLKSSCPWAQEGNKLCHGKLKEDKGDNLPHSLSYQTELEVRGRKELVVTSSCSAFIYPGPEQVSALEEVTVFLSLQRQFLRHLDVSRTLGVRYKAGRRETSLEWDNHQESWFGSTGTLSLYLPL